MDDDAIRLYDLLKEAFLLLDFGDRRLFERFSLTVPRYYALHHIALAPGISPSRLSNVMFCDKSNITRLLQSLEAEGHIERRPHEADGRAQRLFLTERGACLRRQVAAAHVAYVTERLNCLESGQRRQMTAALASLNRSLTADLANRPPAAGPA